MYIFYFPKLEQYISLFPSTTHDDDKLKRCVVHSCAYVNANGAEFSCHLFLSIAHVYLPRQDELRASAIARFEQEQPLEAFHQFCYNDGKSEGSSSASTKSSSASKPTSAADLLLKKPSKEEQKKKSKKPQSQKDKEAKEKKKRARVLADQDDDADMDGEKSATAEDGEEEEHDDFFL